MTTPSGTWNLGGLAAALKATIDVDTDVVKAALLTSSYFSDPVNHKVWSDVSAYESSGTGYTTGGCTVTGVTVPSTPANSWAYQWAASTVVARGAIVRPATGNNSLYFAVAGGTTDATHPAFPTAQFDTVTESGGVKWARAGFGITQLLGTMTGWTGLTVPDFQFIQLYDSNTLNLICLVDTGVARSSTGEDFTYAPDATGFAYLLAS